MTEVERELRARIYQRFVDAGQPPSPDDLASSVGVSVGEVRSALRGLAERHLLALVPGTDHIWMAHPFSGIRTAFAVRTGQGTYWANCAWDALAIPALLDVDATIEASCGESGDEIVVEVCDGSVRHDEAVVHMLVPPRRFWDDIGFT
jgi:DNA-binding transcriptional MocR family regulator